MEVGSCPFFCLVRSCCSANHVHVFYFPRRDPRLITLKSSSEPPGKPPRPSVSSLSCPDLSTPHLFTPSASLAWRSRSGLSFCFSITTHPFGRSPISTPRPFDRSTGFSKAARERTKCGHHRVGRPHVAKRPVTEPTEEFLGLESQTARYHRGGSYVTPDRWFD